MHEQSDPGAPKAPSASRPSQPAMAGMQSLSALSSAYLEYVIDAAQRNVLFWDTLRQRGNQFFEHSAAGAPPVLVYEHELLIDGRTLERPVNYVLYRIVPSDEHPIDPQCRPYVIVDPRAGHGPGIGGSKEDSQIGVAMRAGHPVYFISFRPLPEPGQTLEDVGRAEAEFLREIISRHPDVPKPCVIGNCQAGWAVAMLAAVTPELMGPIVLNGAPLSYWSGVDGKNALRYFGGLWFGAWPTLLLSDLGKDRFDGAYLVQNFENLNPANTLWGKQYGLYSKIDSEPARYLNFEKWWTGFFKLTTEEMDFIVTNLFVGNKLGSSQIMLSDNRQVSLKHIKSPIIVFCSDGDNITPPQQALNWLLDVYNDDDEIIRDHQVIVYTLHKDIGHLGIFVSGSVAKKEHSAIIGTLEFIDRLPPGLYEMLIESSEDSAYDDPRVLTKYEVRFVERSLKDIRALDDSRAEEDYFDTFAQVSDATTSWYRTFVQPFVRATVTEEAAQLRHELNPSRFQHYLLSDRNPLLGTLPMLAEQVAAHRREAPPSNPYRRLERNLSEGIEIWLDAYRDMRDSALEIWFKAVYGPFMLGALYPPRGEERIARVESAEEQDFAARIEELRTNLAQGGFPAALARVILLLSRSDRDVEPRTFLRIDDLAHHHPRLADVGLEGMHRLMKEQFLSLFIDHAAAVAALPAMLPTPDERREALSLAIDVVLAGDRPNRAESQIIGELASLFEIKSDELPGPAVASSSNLIHLQVELDQLRADNQRLREELANVGANGAGTAEQAQGASA